MKSLRLHLRVLLGLSLISASFANAAPLQQTHVASDAIWFAHLDLDQLKKTGLGQHILAEAKKPEAKARLAAFEMIFNFDPLKSLRGVTAYSSGANPQDAVLLVLGKFDTSRLETLARAGKEYESSKHRSYVIHSWIDEKKPGKPRTYGAIHGDGVVVFGQKAGRVGEALDVLDKDRPGLGNSSKLSELAASASSAHFLAAVRRPELVNNKPGAGMLKHFETLSVVSSEQGDQLVTEFAAKVDTAQTARHVATMSQGLFSLLALQSDNPGAMKLAQGATVAESGDRVVTTFTLATADFIQMMKDAEARKKAAKP